MKICIYGAGAVGGYFAARLASAADGSEVSVVDQGAALAAIRQHGLRVVSAGETVHAGVAATDDPSALGVQDLVILAVKGPALSRIAGRIAPLLGPDTVVLTAMNGVLWWFFDGFGGKHAGMRIEAVDPGGAIGRAIPSGNVVGCVVHGSFSLLEPGFVKHGFGKRLIIGAPDGSDSPRVHALAALLGRAGFDAVVSHCIQADTWFKLWGNMTMNPVSALCGATCDRILDDPLVTRFCLDAMAEAAAIGERIGCPIAQSGEERNAVTRELGAFKTSMLQDVEAGKAVELDGLVGAVREIGGKVGVPTPNIDALFGLARLQAQVRGLYP